MATAMNAKLKASEAHWKLMEKVCTAAEEGFDLEKAAMAMAQLLFEAYEKDLFLVIGCVHQPETVRIHLPAMEGRAGVAALQQSERTSQAYLQTRMGRMYLFYSSVAAGKMRARPGTTADLCSAREALGNILNRQNVIAVAVDEVIVPVVLLEMRFGGKLAKPDHFVPEK